MRPQVLSVLGVVVLLACPTLADDARPQSAAQAATASQAAAVLDLSTFPLVNPVGEPNARVIASQSYLAEGTVTNVARKIQSALVKLGFKELEGASFSEGYASATYEREGFVVSLSAFPGSAPSTVSVSINNQGNIDLKQLPVPSDAKPLYAFPSTVSYLTDSSVAKTSEECRRLLLEQGWQLFGDTTVSFFVKSNAVRLQVSVNEAPAQGGKTSIQLTSEQLSVDLPEPLYEEFLQFSDSTGGMLFDSPKSQGELVDYFKDALQKWEWEATTEQPIRIGFRDHLIFRNPDKAMIKIKFDDVEGKTRVDLKHQTAAQVEQSEKKVDVRMAEIKRQQEVKDERMRNPSKLTIQDPVGSKGTEKQPKSIEFSTKPGAAKAAVEKRMASLQAAGWKKVVNVDTKEVGTYTLEKEPVKLEIEFVDPGFIPGAITISIAGDYQLQLGD